MRWAAVVLAFATIVSVIGVSSEVRAACERYPTVGEEFAASDFVFIGRVTSGRMDWSTTEPGEFSGVEYVVQPLKTFKGEPPTEILLYSENSSGRFPMMVAGWYLLFVGPAYEMGFAEETRRERAVSVCGHSFPLLTVPMAFEPFPTELTFGQAMSLAPAPD
ncbi:hypothetical protein GGQ87_002194 [Brevundimonas alba]|uniref:Uncharacterized protein n=1 Tax=Brevundimonas alba TaxID=74314 RepID=A0A7X6BPE7_9CAUL|nr:hypothetical protein [Brevundimonas alba]NJC41899.1 hypothetical protein [Brevundimonas alba]